MNADMLSQQIQSFQVRLTELYDNANKPDLSSTGLFLPSVFKELGTSSEELQVAADELMQQAEEMVALRQQLEEERQRYIELFEFMPDAYLITDTQGKILEANHASATLLHVKHSSLGGKLLINFISIEKRPGFRSKLNQLQQCNWTQNYTATLQLREDESIDVAVTVAPVRDSSGKLVSLGWIFRDITAQKQAQLAFFGDNCHIGEERSKQVYFKGDIIPLESEQLWLVRDGLVKLSTMNECGEEVLVGLASSSMPFGSSLTDLPTYQAIALSQKVELVSISLSEIAADPSLSMALLPQISQRLRQTETLLAISGKRGVQQRLDHLLLFLKEKFGQKVALGTRLSIRLTHQDVADGCCTTRVTITRLLGKLQKQGKIVFDAQNHIVIPQAIQKLSLVRKA